MSKSFWWPSALCAERLQLERPGYHEHEQIILVAAKHRRSVLPQAVGLLMPAMTRAHLPSAEHLVRTVVGDSLLRCSGAACARAYPALVSVQRQQVQRVRDGVRVCVWDCMRDPIISLARARVRACVCVCRLVCVVCVCVCV